MIPLLTLLGFGDTVTFSCGVCCADRHRQTQTSTIGVGCWLLAVGCWLEHLDSLQGGPGQHSKRLKVELQGLLRATLKNHITLLHFCCILVAKAGIVAKRMHLADLLLSEM